MAFSHVGSSHATPQRSPRLLARHSKKQSATILTPTIKHLRRFLEENEGKWASQSGTKPSFKLEKLKCYVTIEEVSITWPFLSSLVACSSMCIQGSIQAADFLMGAVYWFTCLKIVYPLDRAGRLKISLTRERFPLLPRLSFFSALHRELLIYMNIHVSNYLNLSKNCRRNSLFITQGKCPAFLHWLFAQPM